MAVHKSSEAGRLQLWNSQQIACKTHLAMISSFLIMFDYLLDSRKTNLCYRRSLWCSFPAEAMLLAWALALPFVVQGDRLLTSTDPVDVLPQGMLYGL